ncbi:hypothetical protein HPB52_023782 [Rhipicephalus sanguineus]|uniref:RNase H type-1 domain-containing protein n=1 Tax=Rhipicephalus sanguineus TaxID=34632 RepID=A0A9D4Q3T4_RHISA|nr:hypothetical protein HPB52_023782 [Rhipicephalus sanguineus]
MPPGVTVQAYADDTIIIPAKSRERLGELGSAVLKSVIDWTERAKVKLSKEKTYCVLFSHGQGGMEKVRPTVRLNPTDRSLSYKDTLRILGADFDRHLSFFAHADHLNEKTEALVAKLGTLAHMQGGQLRPIQKRTVLLTLLGAYRTTRTTALQVLMRALPVTLELADHPAESLCFPFSRLSRQGAKTLATTPGTHIYTDGSYSSRCAERIGAVGRYKVEDATSAYCAEIVALTEALIHVKAHERNTILNVYTDCFDVGHYLYDCSATAHIADRIAPRLHYIDRRYPELLRHPANRALFIQLVRTHNHLNKVTLPDTHPLIGELFGWSHPVGHMLLRSLTSVTSVSALSRSAGKRRPACIFLTVKESQGAWIQEALLPKTWHAGFEYVAHDTAKQLQEVRVQCRTGSVTGAALLSAKQLQEQLLRCGKTLERLLNGRIYYFLWKNGYIHDNQFGFTHARSAVVALAKLKARLLQLKASKLPAILMALDFQGAFDSVWHPLVLKFFRDRKHSANLYHLLRTFLLDRTVVFTSHAGQLTAHPSLGSPQGSPLSPMLWNVIIYDLLCIPLPSGVAAQAAVLRWTESAKVTLSKEKTYCVLFSHGQGGMERVRPTVRLSPSERSLTYKDSLRILGVVFDRRLSFFMHAEYLREKAETLIAKLDTLARMQGGQLRPVQKLRLYRSVILPAITYASPIWWDELRPDCRLRSRLVSLQRTVLLNLLGVFRTTRTTALQVLMRAPPITLELERCNAEFHLLIERRPIRYGDLSVHPDSVLYAPDPWGEHPAERLAYCFTRLSRQDAKTLATTYGRHVYTDGSYSPRSAGAAFVVLRSNERIGAVGRYQVQDATSAYCAEITALTEALTHVKAHERNTTVRIYTDCLSALQAIADYRTYDPRILTLKTLVRDVSQVARLFLHHVPGHSGIFGNELPDFLASRAAQLGTPRRSLLTPYNVRSALRRQELHRWADEWRTLDSDTALFRWVPNALDIPLWFPPNKALVTFLTGHGRFHFYFCRFRLLPNNLCACGIACEDVDHYYNDCRITAHLAERVRPRLDYLDRRYPVLLRYPANRALFIYIVRADSFRHVSSHLRHWDLAVYSMNDIRRTKRMSPRPRQHSICSYTPADRGVVRVESPSRPHAGEVRYLGRLCSCTLLLRGLTLHENNTHRDAVLVYPLPNHVPPAAIDNTWLLKMSSTLQPRPWNASGATWTRVHSHLVPADGYLCVCRAMQADLLLWNSGLELSVFTPHLPQAGSPDPTWPRRFHEDFDRGLPGLRPRT